MENPQKFYAQLDKETVACPVCNFKENEQILAEDRYKMGISSAICNRCGLIHVNPRPTESEMANFYRNHYRDFYEDISVPTKEYIEKGPFKSRAEFVVNALEPYLKSAKKFVDVGCAEGTLISLVEGKYPSLSTFGIEPSIGFGGYAKKNVAGEVFIGTYQEFLKTQPDSKFDVLATTHVLEHILNPIEYLTGLQSLMHYNSVLYIEVPNIMDKKVRGIGAVHLGHVLSLDPKTLELLLKRAGYEVIEFFTDNLPAQTPAMAVLCKKVDSKQGLTFPTKKEILEKKERFLNNIYPNKVKEITKDKVSLINKIKKYLSR